MTGTRPQDHPELSSSSDGTFVALHVQPGAKRPGISGRHGDALRVRVSAPPADGRANTEVLALLADTFRLPKASVRLVSGASNRRKRVLLVGVDLADAAAVVKRELGEGDAPQRL